MLIWRIEVYYKINTLAQDVLRIYAKVLPASEALEHVYELYRPKLELNVSNQELIIMNGRCSWFIA